MKLLKKIVICIFIFICFISCNKKINENNTSNYVIGNWEISYAIDKETDEDYPLQNIYGTGITYGGTLSLFQDGTFNKYIGITDGDIDSHEGKYQVFDNSITLEYLNGAIENAIYIPENDEIKIQREDHLNNKIIYEFFVRKE